jgi:hypothetical protein
VGITWWQLSLSVQMSASTGLTILAFNRENHNNSQLWNLQSTWKYLSALLCNVHLSVCSSTSGPTQTPDSFWFILWFRQLLLCQTVSCRLLCLLDFVLMCEAACIPIGCQRFRHKCSVHRNACAQMFRPEHYWTVENLSCNQDLHCLILCRNIST